jgi:cytochrome c oxidase subunit 3
MQKKGHPYHLVEPSPWPVVMSLSLLALTISLVFFLRGSWLSACIFFVSVASTLLIMFMWWRDVVHESFVQKQHTTEVANGLKMGMIVFIISEIVFFGVFFLALAKFQFYPLDVIKNVEVVSKGAWIPDGIKTVDAWGLPFFNTLILLLSGTTINSANYALKNKKRREFLRNLLYTILLGIVFLCVQIFEYTHVSFGIQSGMVYASNFYIITGFHGVHVAIGVIFLTVNYVRGIAGHFRPSSKNLGFKFAEWYWHFVDIVWVLLFIFLY